MSLDDRPAPAGAFPRAPWIKRLFRGVWTRLPRTAWSYNAGKIFTRTLLRPESRPYPVEVDFSGHIPMTLDLASFVGNDLYCLDDHYESLTLKLWRKQARQSSYVLDVGSHIGTFALVAAAENPAAQVLAIEADPGNHAALSKHAGRFPNIQTLHAAIADRTAEMWFVPDPVNDGGGVLRETNPGESVHALPVKTCPLDAVCRSRGWPRVDLMKLDVEGFEYELIVRDSAFWKETPPRHLVVEMVTHKRNPGRAREIFEAMRRRGYRANRVQGLYAFPWSHSEDLANWHFELPA